MTKRDVAVWFCKVLALQGMIGGVLGAVRALIDWQYLGFNIPFYPLLSFGLHLFVWFFARGIGTEIAAEGEDGAPMTSGAEIGFLLLRCAGLWLFLSGSINFGPTILVLAYQHFLANPLSPIPPLPQKMMLSNAANGLLQSGIGFLLAFTPRIRAFLRK